MLGYIREVLWRGGQKNIEKVIAADLFPFICKFMDAMEHTEIMVEVTWILTNISSWEDTSIMDFILNNDFKLIEYSLQMIWSDSAKVKEQALWTLANIMGDNQKAIEKIIFSVDVDFLKEITNICDAGQINIGLARTWVWTLSNACKLLNKNEHFITKVIEWLSTFIFIGDKDVYIDACYAFKHLTDVEEPNNELAKF